MFYEISPTLAGPFVMAIAKFLLTLKAVANQEVIVSGTVEEIIAEPLALKTRPDNYSIDVIEADTHGLFLIDYINSIYYFLFNC